MPMPDSLNSFSVDKLIARMRDRGSADAVISDLGTQTYSDLLDASDRWNTDLRGLGVAAGTVCGYVGDHSPDTIALFIALMRLRAIAMPLTRAVEHELPRLAGVAGLRGLVRFGRGDEPWCAWLRFPPHCAVG